jgi:hypothetical protein
MCLRQIGEDVKNDQCHYQNKGYPGGTGYPVIKYFAPNSQKRTSINYLFPL